MDKEQQAKILSEIMEADARDGLYQDISKMETTQTAVDWLIKELDIAKLIAREKLTIAAEVVRQAKQMEKEQIIRAIEDWYSTDVESAQQYYDETYGK